MDPSKPPNLPNSQTSAHLDDIVMFLSNDELDIAELGPEIDRIEQGYAALQGGLYDSTDLVMNDASTPQSEAEVISIVANAAIESQISLDSMPLEQPVENQADTSTPSNQKCPRGRPHKVVNDNDPVKPKNPRGCPPKRPIEIIQQGVVGHLPGEDVIRRPVGCPPKNSDDNDSGVEVSFQHSTVAGSSSTRWIMQGGRIGVAPIAMPEVTSPAPLMPDATGRSPAIASMVHNVDDANSGLSLSAPVLPLIPEIDPNRRVTDDDDDTDEEGKTLKAIA
ncbi:hypothetical protein FRC02_005737 [Tulasnella sp. 418]|nr:hypothetical protein FRC02_005737 [Tulasnella sp. 418]